VLRLVSRRGRAKDPGQRGNGTDSGAEERGVCACEHASTEFRAVGERFK